MEQDVKENDLVQRKWFFYLKLESEDFKVWELSLIKLKFITLIY